MDSIHLDDILERMLEARPNVSDLNISPNRPLQVESDGELHEVAPDPPFRHLKLSPYQTMSMCRALIGTDERAWRELRESGSCDFSYTLRNIARFRVNCFMSQGDYSMVLRKLSNRVPTIEDLHAPEVFTRIASEKNGLILITGAANSGKSTTMAAMLRKVNENRSIHVVTLEDPIEYIHEPIKSTFNQRELGNDFGSFADGLRAALRQSPKIIMVGEMRDRETMDIGLAAAETGHLVISTLHTVDAGSTINRILGMFDSSEQEQVRLRLVDTLRWVVCQRLVSKQGGGRVAAHEIMGANLRTQELIMRGEDETRSFADVIEASEALGWQTFESCLIKLYGSGAITESEALFNSTRKNLMRRKIDYVKSAKGQKTTDIDNLRLDTEYETRLGKYDRE